jgi:hypothetical protein
VGVGAKLMVDIRDERPELFKVEFGLLALLMVAAIFFSHAFIHNYVKAVTPVALVNVPNFIPAAKFITGPTSPVATSVGKQATRMFGGDQWVAEEQIFAQNGDANGWVEWQVNDVPTGKKHAYIYLTKAADYGVVQVSINDQSVGVPVDLYAGGVMPSAAVDLGIIEFKEPTMRLRLTVVGKNPLAGPPFYQFGVQGIALAPPPTF